MSGLDYVIESVAANKQEVWHFGGDNFALLKHRAKVILSCVLPSPLSGFTWTGFLRIIFTCP